MNSNVRNVILSGALGTAAVTVTAALRGAVEGRSAVRPINAISHILWGDQAGAATGVSLRHTVSGLALNGAACGFWAWLYQRGRRSTAAPHSVSAAVVSGVATSVLAYVADYHVVPRRLTPGFELSLSRRSFPWLYGALAVGLCASDVLMSGLFPRRSR